ncbi:MAG: (2E,6E)-farnesyl diphosphate synthase [Gammaproteobacteria bacterium]
MTGQSAFRELLLQYQRRIEDALNERLPSPTTHPERLHKAMRYAVLGGGKRVRPFLVYAAGSALGVDLEALDAPACAVELIHAYSLVHDDLPCMDNDELRRGRPTCHIAFDEATALLVGDALQSLAFYLLSHDTLESIGAERRLEMVACLALASGSRGMAGGQAIDLASVGKELDIAELEDMHIHKTGALIRASVRLGALAASETDPDALQALDHYAKCIGLAFQIRDDILDEEGETDVMGKSQGADRALNKPTYPALLGMSESRRKLRELHELALDSIAGLDARADPLRWMSEYIGARRH